MGLPCPDLRQQLRLLPLLIGLECEVNLFQAPSQLGERQRLTAFRAAKARSRILFKAEKEEKPFVARIVGYKST